MSRAKGMDREHLGPAGAGEAPQHPEREVAQLAVVAGKRDQSHQGAVERCEGDTGEQQGADRHLALAADDCNQDHGGGDAADERRHRQGIGAEGLDPGHGKAVAERNGRDRGESSA